MPFLHSSYENYEWHINALYPPAPFYYIFYSWGGGGPETQTQKKSPGSSVYIYIFLIFLNRFGVHIRIFFVWARARASQITAVGNTRSIEQQLYQGRR